jgi:hypothetical protein
MEADSLSKLQLGMKGGVVKQKEKEYKDAKTEYQKAVSSEATATTDKDISLADARIAKAKTEMEAKRLAYKEAFEEYMKGLHSQRAADQEKFDADKENFDYWTEKRKEALADQRQIGAVRIGKLEKGITTGIDADTVSKYKKSVADIAEANKMLAKYPETKQARSGEKATAISNTYAVDAAKRLEEIRQNSIKLSDLKSKAEIDSDQAAIDAMNDGFAKRRAVEAHNFDKRQIEIVKQYESMLKTENDSIAKGFENIHPAYKKEGLEIPVAENLQDAAGIYDKLIAESSKI